MNDENEQVIDSAPDWDAEEDTWNWDMSWDSGSTWIWGLILIVGGGLLLAQNLFGFRILYLHNWWAVFILVPGLQILGQSWQAYKRNKRLSAGIQRRALGGFFLTALALTFFLNIGWQIVGPAFLILFGLFLLFSRK